ncbi:valine--tRNA ligase [soil metagenome]
MKEFPPKYIPNVTEDKWHKIWENNGIYEAKIVPGKPKYSVVIPPPNITGILHIGHILNNTIQDIYCRWKRMQGFEVCWVPGIDHAGISTQHMLEKQLASEGKTKHDLGREKFVEMGWEWKKKYGGIILQQLKKLGVSVDWTKERFTLDDGLNKAVKEVFVDLYNKGLIYRGTRIINWDPVSQTAVSDDEIEYKEKRDKLYYIKYYFKDSHEFVTVATTRPETMFGDAAVAVNPEDNRYNSYINKEVILPLVNKNIPLIFDDYVDIEFGTGALKITPAHDTNDFEVGKRHGLESINVLTKDSKLNEHGGEFQGMDIFIARKRIIEKLKELGNLEKIEEITHNVAYGSKSGAVIEPYLSKQWFVAMKQLAEPALKVVNDGEIRFHPDRWVKTYNHWMLNIRDWCISRQLWWGHQIPIWYHNETGEIYCSTEPPANIENYTQEPDVLDTWFSSWIWPFSVFGWDNSDKDNSNEALNYFYPTDFLVTAADIIFLWVARMIMAGLEYRKEIPFKDVYFNALVRDGQGKKMSKTLGNSPDPLDVMDKYGADALRFTMVYIAPLGNDVLFDESKTEIGRNFITKLWNAGRFIMTNYEKAADTEDSKSYEHDSLDIWIESRLNNTLKNIERFMNDYRLNDYTKELYNFVWNDFCDWYIEILKVKLSREEANISATLDNAKELYNLILKMLHPVIPVVTEELWHIVNNVEESESISLKEFPALKITSINDLLESEIEDIKEIITAVRNLRTENNIPFSRESSVHLVPSAIDFRLTILKYDYLIKAICRIDALIVNNDKVDFNENAARVLPKCEIYLSLVGLIDKDKQTDKFKKELENLVKYSETLKKKLSNEKFLEKAAKELVDGEKEKLKNTEQQISKLESLIKA